MKSDREILRVPITVQSSTTFMQIEKSGQYPTINIGSQKLPLEFRDVFVNRMSKLQSKGRMLKSEEITTEAERVAYEIQLDMVYEYTSRQLGMPWSFETEFDYGWGKTILASEVLSREAFETYRHIMGSPDSNAEDRDFLYEYARLTVGNPEQIMEELREGGWIDESKPGVIKNNRPENVMRIKNFWEP